MNPGCKAGQWGRARWDSACTVNGLIAGSYSWSPRYAFMPWLSGSKTRVHLPTMLLPGRSSLLNPLAVLRGLGGFRFDLATLEFVADARSPSLQILHRRVVQILRLETRGDRVLERRHLLHVFCFDPSQSWPMASRTRSADLCGTCNWPRCS